MATARHPKATFYVQQQLFSGLANFTELEQKIAALPDEQSRGAAFEVFAEAYFATQRKYDAAQVWPDSSIPLDILKNLSLTVNDRGVDGVLQTLLGEFNAYQVKFRTGRPKLTWRELSTFFGQTDSSRIHSRVVFTNCDEFPDDLEDRRGFYCIRGLDLDRLETDDFRAIETWLADSAFIAPKKSPQPHQTEALNALLTALQAEPRVSAIMACGTGKTLVALWVTERLEAKKVLVLLPSLALLRQTLHEWVRETSLPSFVYLCVCSDPTVKEGIDTLKTRQTDLDFEVRTDAASVRSFLDAPFAGVKIVFSTYQSAHRVGEAMLPGESFDFAIFDEAHKTAGREGRNSGFALEEPSDALRIASIMSSRKPPLCYIVVDADLPPRREIEDAPNLFSLMLLVSTLEKSGCPTLVSHCSSDMVLMKAAGASNCASGKFFNVRRFSRSRFDEEQDVGGGQLPYWFEQGLLAFLRIADIARLRRSGFDNFIGIGASNNAFASQILEQFANEPKKAWLGLSWRQYLAWFELTEKNLSIADAPGIVSGWLKEAEQRWEQLETKEVLLEERQNNGHWIRPWRQALGDFSRFGL